ncbi:MAG: hypothetical protein AAFN12_07885 [Cyanobacteria bacterium J06560_2]
MNRFRFGLATAALLLFAGELPARAQRTTVFDLNQAICASEWTEAIGITGTLIGDERTTDDDRQSLLTLRRQLEYYRADEAIMGRSGSCDLTSSYLLPALPVAASNGPEALGWNAAVAEVTENQFATQVVTESPQLRLPVNMEARAGLTPAQPVDLERGMAVVPGHVGAGHEVYAFVAGMGDHIDINLEVTQVMTGTLYTSDDSQLFIFNRDGILVESSDDDGGNQSSVNGFVAPKTDVYFAVVTSYNNDPIFNQDNQITGWRENGGGRFDYTLSISGVTPTSALVR